MKSSSRQLESRRLATVLLGVLTGLAVPALVVCAVLASSEDEPAQARVTDGGGDLQNGVDERAIDPHKTMTECRACHGVQQPREGITPAETDVVCLRCHDGEHAATEAHPILRQAVGETTRLPAGWPTVDGQLACLTCHDVGQGGPTGHPQQPDNPRFLRGGRPASLQAFCGECHKSDTSHEPYNPHRMVSTGGNVQVSTCSFCHDPAMDAKQNLTKKTGERTGDAQLRASEFTLCLGCHSRHADYFDPGHIGSVMPAAKKTKLQARANFMPLGAGDRIQCSTCHNPHQAGVFSADSALGRGGMRFDDDARGRSLRFRGLGKELCYACHQ